VMRAARSVPAVSTVRPVSVHPISDPIAVWRLASSRNIGKKSGTSCPVLKLVESRTSSWGGGAWRRRNASALSVENTPMLSASVSVSVTIAVSANVGDRRSARLAWRISFTRRSRSMRAIAASVGGGGAAQGLRMDFGQPRTLIILAKTRPGYNLVTNTVGGRKQESPC
jgi:hypothetical protein